ncbi:TRAP transporter small permease [Psychromonas sp. L1A2]|uniref:TRAP transporter small permease n=1 Tax=Psychromonas sp. L1A2 TaxID=2686356 RepID=UPI001357709E|nr:TRAP transporter small permease [Psychromonas sp. L1A2]
MRTVLDKLYFFSGALSGLCIVAICVVILARVIGRWFSIEIPSSDDFAGFLLAAASFLGLAYTFRSGDHIRVNLFISRLPASLNRWIERFILIIGSILIIYLTWQLALLALESHEYNDLSSGYIPVPLWIVQLPLGIGMVTFSIAILDQIFCHLFFGQMLPKSEEEALADSQQIDITTPDSLNTERQ